MKLNIQLFGGRGASSNSSKISFSELEVGDTFQYKNNGSTFNVEITRKNKNDYTVQAKSYIENGKTINLFGSTWITNLVEKETKNTPKSYIKLKNTKNWKRK